MKKITPEIWFDNGNNSVLSGEGFYISYNKSIVKNVFDDTLVMLGEAESREGKSETALVILGEEFEFGRIFLILNGDFRAEYEEAYPDKDKCIEVYNKNKAEYNSDFTTKNYEA